MQSAITGSVRLYVRHPGHDGDMTKALTLRLISIGAWIPDACFQRLIAASSAALLTVDSACEPGLIMQFSWGKVAEAHAGIGA